MSLAAASLALVGRRRSPGRRRRRCSAATSVAVDAGRAPTRPTRSTLVRRAAGARGGGTTAQLPSRRRHRLDSRAAQRRRRMKSQFDTGEAEDGPAQDRRHAVPARARLATSSTPSPRTSRSRAPTLLDVYLDARPNDRVRGMVVMRTLLRPHAGAERAADASCRRSCDGVDRDHEPVVSARSAVAEVRHRAHGVTSRRAARR